jgi:hypothetical protein
MISYPNREVAVDGSCEPALYGVLSVLFLLLVWVELHFFSQ